MATALLRASLKNKRKEFLKNHNMVDAALCRLQNRESGYAAEHRALIAFYRDVIAVVDNHIEVAKEQGLWED